MAQDECGSPVIDATPSALWWHTQSEEYLRGGATTRDAAIDAGIWEYGGEPFLIAQGKRFKYRAPAFCIERIAEDFDDANIEYGPEDYGPSADWTDAACSELERALEATMDAWLEKHGYNQAWAIDASDYEKIDASAIEARRAETGTGSVHDSAVGDSRDAQPSPEQSS